MRIIETVWIPLSDGCRLAARLWLPDESSPVPAILEYLPYRRRDRHRGDDAVLHPGLAGCGYAALRVDMRGAGDSDGLMNDEYTPQEWRDACEVIAWIAAQDWCSGSVGLIGISWSGFNALQIAALRPPALKAIVTACSTDDRYADDMHYMGGALLKDNLQYGATLFTWTPTPPDPAIVGDRWKAMWLARLNAMDLPPAARWMQHPQRDDYFDGPPAATALQLLGRAEVRLELCADNPLAMLAVRLNAVAPDGTAIRVSYGLLNLAARNGFDRAEPLVPGHYYQINVLLKAAAFVLPSGYRLRVALSTCYWPLAAPLPVRPVLTVQRGSVILPLRDPDAEVCPPPALGDPWSSPPVPARVLVAPARGRQRVIRDMDDGETTLRWCIILAQLNWRRPDCALRRWAARSIASMLTTPPAPVPKPGAAPAFIAATGRPGWRFTACLPLTPAAGGWRLESILDAWDGEEPCFSRRWRLDFPFFPVGR
ncbi:hypothetical protein SODG_003697 [Sodalis praecaptivus]